MKVEIQIQVDVFGVIVGRYSTCFVISTVSCR